MRRSSKLIATLAALAMVAAGCSGDDDDNDGAEGDSDPVVVELPDLQLAAALTPFESCDALLAWIKAEASARVGPYGLGGGPVYYAADDVATDAAAPLAREETAAGGDADLAQTGPTTPEFSGTNVQVEGVDEPDVVKTDGTRVLALAGGNLQLVDASVDPPVVLDTLPLESGYGAQLLMSGDRALVLNTGQYMDIVPLGAESRIAGPSLSGSTITEIDLSGNELRVAGEITFEGYYISARMIDDVVRVVLQSNPEQRLGFVYPSTEGSTAEDRAEEVNRDVIADSTIEDWLPHVSRNSEEDAVAVDCANVQQPQSFSGFGVLSVLTVDLSEGLADGVDTGNGTAIMAGGETVYASPTHLYVATQEYIDWEALTESEQRTVDQDFGTAIHRFDISDPTRAVYEASGRVDGHLLNQYSMDEQDDVLRVATTKGSPWSEGEDTSESQVVTLAESSGELTQLGAVGGLGKGETIHSVRFLGDTAYVVTFRQTDPLYTVDLSDPAAPAVVGELKILGYSAYLHPVADGYLLGIGQDATEEGQTTGLQVALFDVRDPAAPTRVAQSTLPNAYSDAEWDPHAFLYWAPTGLTVVPVNGYNEGLYVQEAIGFTVDVDAATVAELGRVQHPGVTEGGVGVAPVEPGSDVAISEPVPDYTYVPPITRSFVIGENLWTLSDAGLLRSDLATLAAGPFVSFPA